MFFPDSNSASDKGGFFTGRELNWYIKLSFTLLNIYDIK